MLKKALNDKQLDVYVSVLFEEASYWPLVGLRGGEQNPIRIGPGENSVLYFVLPTYYS